MSDLRQEVAAAISKVRFAAAPHELNVPAKYLLDQETDAAMCVVEPLAAAHAKFDERLSDLQAEYLKREQVWDRTRELLTRERDQARQVARQANNNCADFAEALGLPRDAYGDAVITAIDRLRWLHAEAVWNWRHLADRYDRALEREHALRASAVVLPEDWRNRLGECESSGAAVDLVESWLPAAVEAAPLHGPDDHEWVPCKRCPNPDQPCACAGGVCCEAQQAEIAAGVSGTGTEASDA